MVVKVGINGFGRIGRLAFRRIQNVEGVEVTRINDLTDPVMLAHLLKYDTTQGRFDGTVEVKEGGFEVNGKFVKVSAERDPEQIDWANDGVEIVLEATGFFAKKEAAEKHLKGGAKKVVITAPGGSDVKTVVFNTNHDVLDGTETVISGASCTTNSLAPVAKVLNDQFGIVNGLMTTVHAITNDQKNIDNPHKDLRRARSCNESIIPTSTGAAKALKEVLPEVEGKLHGMALRVPTKNVSLVDLVVDLEQNVTVTQVNDAFKNADLTGVLDVEEAPLVSVDFNTNPHSAIIDSQSTMVMGQNKVKVIAWYDNEWGYSNRVVEVADKIGQLIDDKAMVKAI